MSPRPEDVPIEVFEELPSTNDSILQAGESGRPEGTAHVARRQTRGRGRGNHAWWSPKDAGLWMSVLLRPRRSRALWGGLALLTGTAAREALVELGVPGVELYWPNDLLVGRRKIGGVLGEVRSRASEAWIAMGVGINIDFRRPEVQSELPPDLRETVTSMTESGDPATTDPRVVARTVLRRLWPLYRRFEGGEELGGFLGDQVAHRGLGVTVKVGNREPWGGHVEGLGPHGELLVRIAAGHSFAYDRPPPGGDWTVDDPGVVAVTGGQVVYGG